MSLYTILETLLLGPLKLVFETIFTIANRVIGHPGLAIAALSLAMNLLVLPLYRRADAMQEAARDVEAKLHDGVTHIKKHFSGDERMMILQTYYRQNHYSPLHALNGSVSLLLEIPFFMAAYQFLSHLETLKGTSLGPITDLSAPDGLLVIGGLTLNLLPILMTLINVISSAIYLKGFPLKTKVQLYAMALFFLVFLYTSPSGLVLYWTLNNLFSLVKTIFYKLKNPGKILGILSFLLGIALLVFGLFLYETAFIRRKIFLIGAGFILLLPLPLSVFLKKHPICIDAKNAQPSKKLFLTSSIFLTVLIGLLIPSTYIAASPQEYIDISYFHNPLLYIVSSVCLAAGTFLIWMRVFYWLANDFGKAVFDKLVAGLCGITIMNYMFFGTELGIITSSLQYEQPMAFTSKEQLFNLLAVLVMAGILYFAAAKWKSAVTSIVLIAALSLGGMSVINIAAINDSVNVIRQQQNDTENPLPTYRFSKTGQNVVVLILDRAMNEYVPYIFNELPELKEKFSGFTHYANTISFGGFTNMATPALYGGYEYTPVELNRRDSEYLQPKHNEALKVMPVLFSENGYHATVVDPIYANYQWIPDISLFDEYDNVDAYRANSLFGNLEEKQQVVNNRHRNFFYFSLMKSMPLIVQPTLYNYGLYNAPATDSESLVYTTQTIDSISTAHGLSNNFANAYNVMVNLSSRTEITDDAENQFLLMYNDMTHEPALLQEPDYVPAVDVDNREYDAAHADRFTVDGVTLSVTNEDQMKHYQANVAAFIQLGKWFDYLKENGVYDNTRIILVADHGRQLNHFSGLSFTSGSQTYTTELFCPLFMVKDFNSDTFTTSDEFMTNADVPTLAMKDIIENPVNPFTGKEINSDEKTAHDQYVMMSTVWELAENCQDTFVASHWLSISSDSNVWDFNSWTLYTDEKVVLREHEAPY